MKRYIEPKTRVVTVKSTGMLAASGGIGQDATLGRGYNKDDVSYGREDNAWDIWGTGADDEE